MKNTFGRLLGITAALALVACGSNPYPQGETFSDTDPSLKPQVFPALGLSVASVMEFTEGQEGTYEVRASAPGGQAIVNIEGLPPTAVFDPIAKRITWTPSFSEGNDPEHPENDSRAYPIKISMHGSNEPLAFITREATLLVRDVRHPLLFWGQETSELTEGRAYAQAFILASEDNNVENDIRVYSNDMPRGTTIERDSVDPMKYWVRFTPSFSEVQRSDARDSQGYYKDLTVNLQALAPGRRAAQKVLRWKIRDQRQNASDFGPARIEATGDVMFSLGGWDGNGETRPRVQLVSRPPMGQIVFGDETSPADRFVTVYSVRWFQIPPEAYGREHEFKFSLCTFSNSGNQDACRERIVRVNLTATARPAPVFDRAAWPLGEVKEAAEGQNVVVNLPVVDAETLVMLPQVAFEYSSDRCEAAWANGVMKVTAKTAGYCQLNVVATSAFGVRQVESFVLKVNPPTTPPTP